ncbi:MAG: RNA-splicing ligase RtcB [Candidatus Thermofonsia Clade 1 bacterium]|uniref:3'-phosphate/5'-hydroxy nucleic acid ligase n=1 Tax=Candidatus Thermofonsia Clade 1 bacterium TaxID=2364210 RepID=A0A2M8PHL3_9CHLR|nr:MAG: RNA-splicing ligase RtcB [Candidatus Thermofonsia Clade 1 bacterium]
MNAHDLLGLGYPPGKAIGIALQVADEAAAQGEAESALLETLRAVLAKPEAFSADPRYKGLAKELMRVREQPKAYQLDTYAPYRVWGREQIEPGALQQMERAVRLPIAVRGALMPDAHQGYGLPIGGVLATYNAVIPYAVGVDIACRMRLTIFEAPPHLLEQKKERFRKALEENTCFGAGNAWPVPRQHAVMDDPLWREHPVARQLKDLAWRQLGTSGSGNHFVEFGVLDVSTPFETPEGAVPIGRYLALLSHSGSRRFGYEIANHYTRIAMSSHSGLPKDFQHLAWLDLAWSAGAEYWEAMQLAGRYASANHAVIHQQLVAAVRLPVLGVVENHHNFAWREVVDGQEVIVHRKGATPAGEGALGVIPGSMADRGYVVRGRGVAAALNSAAHGAGRRMSRAEAFRRFNWDIIKRKLRDQGVEVLSAGLDEVPNCYKAIDEVMAAQADLVEVLASFQPKLVKMDGSPRSSYHPED